MYFEQPLTVPRYVALGNASGRAFVRSLSPVAWYQYGIGITQAGGLVSAWADQTANSRNLLQVTGTNQPALQADNSILFDGADNYLKAAPFTFSQPNTIYFLGRQITSTSGDRIFDGNADNTGSLRQSDTLGTIGLTAGSIVAANTNWALNTYAVLATVVSGADSLIQVNNTTPTTGNAGANNAGGFTLGTIGSAGLGFSNIQAKEVILFATAHDAATRARVIRYLMQVGGI